MPPLTAGFVTVTGTVPAVIIELCGMLAVTTPELTQAVVIFWFAKLTTAPEVKLEPLTVNMKAAPPAVALAGARLEIVGAVPGDGGVVV